MPRTLISMLVIFAILVLGFILLALRSCENPPVAPDEPIQYDNTHEETTMPESIQYESTLPNTGGVKPSL